MALKITATADHVVQLAVYYGRLSQFGYNGWRMLAEAIDQLSDDIGEDIEVDILAWCCDYSHAANADEAFEELQHYYVLDIDGADWEKMDDEEKLEAVEEFLLEYTTVMVCDDKCIIWATF